MTTGSLTAIIAIAWLGCLACACPTSVSASPQQPAAAAGPPATASTDTPEPEPEAASTEDKGADQEPPASPRLVERVLKPREVLGTTIRGHFFIDGLPLSPDGLQIGKAAELRRARISFGRQLPLRWEVLGSVELASGRVELRDLFVRRGFGSLGTFTIGNQSEPMGLDELTSALSQPFLEPSLPTALVPRRNFGVMLANRSGDLLYQAGVFGSGTEQEGRRDLGSAITARLTHRRLLADGEVRHLGVALSGRNVNGREQFRSVPEIGIGQEFSVDTGAIDDTSRTLRAGAEYLATFSRLALQGEVLVVRVERDAASDLEFGGAYLQAAWTVWGDGARYDDGNAVLVRAPVADAVRRGDAFGRGNLAVSARLSSIDLSDEDIDGGRQVNLTLGATWDIGPRTRIAGNVVRVLDITGPNAQAKDTTAVAVRFQYAF